MGEESGAGDGEGEGEGEEEMIILSSIRRRLVKRGSGEVAAFPSESWAPFGSSSLRSSSISLVRSSLSSLSSSFSSRDWPSSSSTGPELPLSISSSPRTVDRRRKLNDGEDVAAGVFLSRDCVDFLRLKRGADEN